MIARTQRLSELAALLAVVLWSGACKESSVETKKTTSPTPAHTQTAPPPFCLAAVRIQADVRLIEGITEAGIEEALVRSLLQGEPAIVDGRTPATKGTTTPKSPAKSCMNTAPEKARVGVFLRTSAAIFGDDGKVVGPDTAKVGDELAVSVAVQVERAGEGTRPDLGISEITAAVPFAKRSKAEMSEFVQVRIIRAAAMSARDAFGQLMVRELSDEAVLKMLAQPKVWRLVAGLREVGERGLEAGVKAAEKHAQSSRKEVALVAIGTLGRLGMARSLMALAGAVDARAPEVVDAALTAIADIGGDKAETIIGGVADAHGSAWIRRRARRLLRSMRERK